MTDSAERQRLQALYDSWKNNPSGIQDEWYTDLELILFSQEMADAFPDLLAQLEAAERVIVTIYYEVVLGLTVQSTARLANMGSEMEQHIIKALGGNEALMALLERYKDSVTPSWAKTQERGD